MRQLAERAKILGRARFDLGFGVLGAFGGALVVALFFVAELPRWVSGTVAIGWIVTMVTIILFRAERDAKSDEAGKLQQRVNEDERDEAINLTTRVVTAASRSLRAVTEQLRATPGAEPGRLKLDMLRQLCRDVRTVFEGDNRGVDGTTWPHNFFKLAIYEPEPSPVKATHLRRTYYDYPEGVEPSPETETFEIEHYKRAAVVLAFLEQNVVVLEDVKEENDKPPNVKRWMNRRENQAQDYESMVCAAIVTGQRGHPDRKCLGVLVVDTNREQYFREDRSFEAFLGNLLNPFRTILTLILEVQSYFTNGAAPAPRA